LFDLFVLQVTEWPNGGEERRGSERGVELMGEWGWKEKCERGREMRKHIIEDRESVGVGDVGRRLRGRERRRGLER
jgi:hypothetical protein